MKRILTILSQKWPEYILEILVITIGILGAFALNNWNTSINQEQERLEMLRNLKTEFQINLKEVQDRKSPLQLSIGSLLQLMQLTTPRYDTLDESQVNSLIQAAIYFQTYDGSSGAINNAINNNKLVLLKSDSLKSELASWFGVLDSGKELEARLVKVSMEQMNPYLQENFSLVRMDNSSNTADIPRSNLPHDNRKIMGEMKFQSIVNDLYWQKQYTLYGYEYMEKKIKIILQLIEKEGSL